ncbi:conjugal transfer protein MobB [uncultured Chryseobacterium sp.]|uniref:conjugal transfer protein MobB n=1 Tax=uncultured Chryseobacterium sp. TaxID=259322 RepID=UPI002588AA30|nr:conjugal transfer protein MobB [uncultured Chryseobacterium sp.]
MIAKIGRSSNLYGALSYNQIKVEKERGEILLLNKMIESSDGRYTVVQLLRSFEPYLINNRNTEKHSLHISLNPDPKDRVNNELFCQIASDYMNQMGYGAQPFIVFKHTDIERGHIHIVTVCVDENGKKISDQFEKIRSMSVCRTLEQKYGLIAPKDKKNSRNEKIFRPVDYRAGDIKRQIASVIRHLPEYYQFQTLGEYNALLSLFNITTEKVDSNLQGSSHRGLLYIPLDEKGQKAGHPFKSSLFGKNAGLASLELHFAKGKEALKDPRRKNKIKVIISAALRPADDEASFKKQLLDKGINVVVRRNSTGRIYGITFIDHTSKAVFNGSQLAKELSANSFNEYWNNDIKTDVKEPIVQQHKTAVSNITELHEVEPHHWFDFLSMDQNRGDLLVALGGLLPEAQGEDYEEQDFTNRMKKKRKNTKGMR